ncbi:MAG: hypothetical protein IEMM0008_1793 [bacterium]|nr:MAG: hypothetical protein IEMM0008_1793 [bacterium]
MKKTIVSLLIGILVLSILMVFQPPITWLWSDDTTAKDTSEGIIWVVGVIVDDVATPQIIIAFVVPILTLILTVISLILVLKKLKA